MNRIRRLISLVLGVLALIALAGGVMLLLRAQETLPRQEEALAPPISPLQTPTRLVETIASSRDWPTLTPPPPRPPPPSPTPRITPTPPVSPGNILPYDPSIPLRAESITLAAARLFDVSNPVIFKAWSPDGERFLFGRSEDRHILVQFEDGAAANGFWYDLWIADADGSHPYKLADMANSQVWSPDGQSVAYLVPVGEQGVEGRLYVVDVEHLQPREIAACDLGGIDDLAWLPTGEIVCRQNGVMYAVRSDGSQTRQLNSIFTSDFIKDTLTGETLPPVFQGQYHISPDGEKMAYIKTGAWSSLWITDLDGSDAVEVRIDPYISYDWAWSPDSGKIAFSVPNGQGRLGTDLWAINADGSNLRRVTMTEREDAMCMDPTWSPDGRVIAFTHQPNRNSEPESVWVVNEDGTNPHLLVDLAFDPKWSPNGDEIAVLRLRSPTDNPETFLIQVGLGQR